MFEVYNSETNVLSITDTYHNFHLRRSGKINQADFIYGPSGSNFTQKCWAEISTVGCNSPMLVLRGPLDTIVTPHHSIQQNKFFLHTWWNYTKASGVEWYLFDDWIPPAGPNYGIEMRDAQNVLRYHSSWHRLRVLQLGQIPTFGPNISAFFDYAIPAYAHRVGVCMLAPRVSSYQQDGEHMAVIQEAVCFTSDTNIRIGQTVATDGDGWWNLASMFWNTTPSNLLVVDIQGLPLGVNLG